jgi:phosphoribosylglycinamide formyltransferase-1
MADENQPGYKFHLAIFASGTGSNADKICCYFKNHPEIRISLIVSNKKDAGVLNIARVHGIDTAVILNSNWNEENVRPLLDSKAITHIVLAGFLRLLPAWLIAAYEGRIVNIHPALLPKYGGKGMYGHHVHEKVKSSGELISGITIHEVNENYDEGKIIFQESIQLEPSDSADMIAKKVLQLEHFHYPRTIEKWVEGKPYVI